MNIERKRHWAEILNALRAVADVKRHGAPGITSHEDTVNFCQNPSEYAWRYVGKREMLLPRICDATHLDGAEEIGSGTCPDCEQLRFAMAIVWIVEGTLRRGESNVLMRRCAYLAGDWSIIYGEGFDAGGVMTDYYLLFDRSVSETGHPARWYRTGKRSGSR